MKEDNVIANNGNKETTMALPVEAQPIVSSSTTRSSLHGRLGSSNDPAMSVHGGGLDSSTVSALTMDEELMRNSIGEQRCLLYTTRRSLSYAANKPVITPRTSMEARMSDRAREMELSNLKIQNLPICGRQKELEALMGAFSKIQEGGQRGLLLVDGVSGTGKTSLVEHASFQKRVRSQGGIFVTAKCDWREQNEPFASVQDAMSLLSEKILNLQKRKDQRPSKQPNAQKDTDTNTVEKDLLFGETKTPSRTTGSSASIRTAGSGSLSHLSTLDDVQEKLALELTENEWKVLIQTVPAIGALVANHNRTGNAPVLDGAFRTASMTSTIGEYPKMDGSSIKENSDQLKFAYRHFIRVVAALCPLVIVFDDCQWQDDASMEWVKSILTDANKEIASQSHGARNVDCPASLLVIASYRSDEVHDEHRLTHMTKELQSYLPGQEDVLPSSTTTTPNDANPGISLFIQQIHLGNLQVRDIVALLEDLLNSNTDDVEELAEILHKKSKCTCKFSFHFFPVKFPASLHCFQTFSAAGNAFFVVQFLMRLKEDRRFSFSIGLLKWTWNSDEIRESYTATSNVADILADRMKKSGVALAILPIASALGNEFSPQTLQMIVDHTKTVSLKTNNNPFFQSLFNTDYVIHPLDQCIDEGLLEMTPLGMYKFCHDKIQETAMSFLDKKIKVCIGDYFMDRFDDDGEKFGDAFYPLLSLVNQQLNELATDEKKRFRVVELNALAGERALRCGAFEPASVFFINAMRHLSSDHWAKHRNISLRIYIMAGAAAFNAGAGYIDRVKGYTEEVLAQTDLPLLDKIDLCYTMMDVYDATFTSKANKANYEFGRSLLEDFGCRFPKGRVGTLAKTMTGLLNAKITLRKKLSPQALETMPISTDRQAIAIMKILDKFTNAVFHTKSDLLPLVMLRQAQYTDRFGLTPYAAVAYPLLGMLFCSMDDFEA